MRRGRPVKNAKITINLPPYCMKTFQASSNLLYCADANLHQGPCIVTPLYNLEVARKVIKASKDALTPALAQGTSKLTGQR